MRRITIDPFNQLVIYVASKNSLYKSENHGLDFKKIAVFKDEEVQHIFFDSHLADDLYIVTSRNFYRMNQRLEKLFPSNSERLLYTAIKHKGNIFIGTSEGLYSASEDLLIWKKIKGVSDFSVYSLCVLSDNLYLASDKGVYRVNGEHEIDRLFITRVADGEGQSFSARVIAKDMHRDNSLWLGTNRGLFFSNDSGTTWDKVYLPGIDNLSINCIVQTKLQDRAVYIGTTKGFFLIDLARNVSRNIFEGLSSPYIYWAEFSSEGEIYLATARGLFKSEYFTVLNKDKALPAVPLFEPSVVDVQQMALKYNEVHPDKIRKWRNSLKYRALFPSVSLDYDKTVYGSTSKEFFHVGPRDWGVNLKWDVGNLIWNNYEDDVDTRSRLDTQLRLDILDEINRVYFERIRLKHEIEMISFSQEELFKKDLRLQELTAIIDGYTGGLFSMRTKRLDE